MDNLIAIRKGGSVKRFHTVTMLKENLNSSHSWGVATLIQDICPSCSKEVLLAALYHDVAEHITGDVSAPTKWKYPELSKILSEVEGEVDNNLGISVTLSSEEKRLLKFADMADLVLTCVSEYRLGNSEVGEIVNRGVTYLEDQTWTPECVSYLPKIKRYVKEFVK